MARPRNEYPNPQLKKLPSGIYSLTWTENGKTRTQSTRTRVKKEAETLRDLKAIELRTPGSDASTATERTVAEVCQYYMAFKSQRGKLTNTIKYALKPVTKILGEMPHASLSYETMEFYVEQRRKIPRGGRYKGDPTPVKDATIVKDIVQLRAALKFASDQKFAAPVPVPASPVSAHPEKFRTISTADFKAVFNEAPQHIQTYLAIAWFTGQRRQAILQLKWSDITFDQNAVHKAMVLDWHGSPTDEDSDEAESPTDSINRSLEGAPVTEIRFGEGVGNKRRAPPLRIENGFLLSTLLAARKADPKCEYVISWWGKPMADIKTGLKSACTRAGVDPFATHDLRHTNISRLISAGVNAMVVAKRVNLSVNIIEKRYAHLSPEVQKLAEEVLAF